MLPHEHERAKYAELFSKIYARTATSTIKEAFSALKSIIDQKAQSGNQQDFVLTIEFYIRAALEVASLIKKILSRSYSFKDDKLAILWGVHSRKPTLQVIDGLL